MKRTARKKNYPSYNFPGLSRPPRVNAINDNSTPTAGLILKHTALMTGAFLVLYFIHTLI